ncbi:hypothetical protein [Brevundimonas sp. SORGH_AS_0993]|uniref:hypothetical protein n=1 Tax=Brevundimonas sp. SORGH_AS_0993 TaxID=3041794 RepID=UPI002789E114|nr:hypothetical protein [Brevundimonas sp. SORGH_AS_0993]MDQ1154826.1 hypothetical protein [Brevundimonas sp. SORGH_AS_0993]
MTSEHREITEGLKLAGIAIGFAIVTAMLMIGIGEALLRHPPALVSDGSSQTSPQSN